MKQRHRWSGHGRRRTGGPASAWKSGDYGTDWDESVYMAEIDVEMELPGSVYMVPDKFWGFQAIGRDDHPGACTRCDAAAALAILVKGSDIAGLRGLHGYLVIGPTRDNGLKKPTAFALQPRPFRLRRVLLMHPNRRIGQLDADDALRLQRELERLFPTE